MSPESSEAKARDLAGEQFWEQWWEKTPLPAAFHPDRRGLKNYPSKKFHGFFQGVFKGYSTAGKRLLEVGCAQSVLLPYFSKYFGFAVSGLDRSEVGCQRSRLILEREGVKGDVYCADVFLPPSELLENFDVVVSFGVVEHFTDTVQAVKAVARFARPGGKIITEVPNLTRLLGAYQKILDRALYNAHVPLDRKTLETAHREAGLEVESCIYFLPIGLSVLNVDNWWEGFTWKLIGRLHVLITYCIWWVDGWLLLLRPNGWTSPYVVCVATKPGGELVSKS